MKKLVLTLFITGLAASAVYADTVNTYDTGLLNSNHLKEFNLFERNTQVPSILLDQQTSKTYLVNSVDFEKNTVITKEELTNLVSTKIGTKLSSDEISQIKAEITDLYSAKGYQSAIINVSSEKSKDGNLVFTIYEGPKTDLPTDTKTNDQIIPLN